MNQLGKRWMIGLNQKTKHYCDFNKKAYWILKYLHEKLNSSCPHMLMGSLIWFWHKTKFLDKILTILYWGPYCSNIYFLLNPNFLIMAWLPFMHLQDVSSWKNFHCEQLKVLMGLEWLQVPRQLPPSPAPSGCKFSIEFSKCSWYFLPVTNAISLLSFVDKFDM